MIHVHKAADGLLKQAIEIGAHRLVSDAGPAAGGEDAGPDPHDLLDAALGACTALTLTMVARRRQLPLQDVRVDITHREAGGIYRIERRIELVGELSAEQRDFLLGIANKCPVHRSLMGRFEIATTLDEGST